MADQSEYKTGFPTVKGWYDCMIDGIEIRLLHNYCELTGKHKWIDEGGGLVSEPVMWRDGKKK